MTIYILVRLTEGVGGTSYSIEGAFANKDDALKLERSLDTATAIPGVYRHGYDSYDIHEVELA